MKELTKAEEEIMQILWKIEKGFVKDIIEQMPEPRPAYNTVSTIVRILEKKGFVGYNAFGKTHEYFPLVAEDKYKSFFLKNFMSGYFGGSFEKLVSFFAKDNNLDVKELDQLMRHVKEDLNENEQQNGSAR
ncbi:BlaI/MecI/CopY family transcriptional regulator [Pontibacter sp. BT310]|uniref:BlaI/MecI/CopY family transcriptional regulator n=1 Tax=Pontibacter populi TaxID=890055 RepID=A0ABS6XC51_9BACT|nr:MULTISPECIES: BlaI/MecI/CopY family transcriptional regulator [Pontibacter]MBJ6118638.1 BlaI/MecI/CopY family transcriptional regulator [Pontibacter sp. BT310]MBR0571067.1 BlaI/MecI/CopY family transcriptional regulator [Microvirga sp. STS03]MBW3365492.1 BlaI/MecI/CopY family transcriptional regulator [Pontibacter populi]